MNEELEREVFVMCNLSQGVKAEGINIGEMRMLVQLVRDGDLKIERAAEKAKMTILHDGQDVQVLCAYRRCAGVLGRGFVRSYLPCSSSWIN